MSFYRKIIRPILFKVQAETAHEFGNGTLKIALSTQFAQNLTRKTLANESFDDLERFGLTFENPLGVAAGFDKNGKVVNQLAALGFGFVEVGTVTFEAQKGNEKPRLFRLPQDNALINRLGFNNDGAEKIVERLKKTNRKCVLGVNIGKNKNVPNEAAIENYLKSFDLAFAVADYIAVNVSSPNTPNLRDLQKAENLEELLNALQSRNYALQKQYKKNLPLLVKIAPDLAENEVETITDICLRLKISGIIATNTTVSRANLRTGKSEIEQIGNGGLSGRPLKNRSNEIIERIYKTAKGKLPIVGVGGIFTAEDAFEKIASGACLLESYTGFVYQGLTFARDINFGLAKILKDKNFNSLDEAIGTAVKI